MRQCRTITERNFTSGEQVTTEIASTVSVTAARAEAIDLVKAVARRKILAILPEYKQRNLIARGLEIAAAHGGLPPDRYPEPERSEWLAGQASWERVKALRAASDRLEEVIATLPDSPAVFDFVESIDRNPLWPE